VIKFFFCIKNYSYKEEYVNNEMDVDGDIDFVDQNSSTDQTESFESNYRALVFQTKFLA
jgi:hypothetical protein